MNNPPAFPQWDGHAITSEPLYLRGGMTLRDYFASKYQVWRDVEGRLLGYSEKTLSDLTGKLVPQDPVSTLRWEIEVEVALKLLHADAMLAQREKESA